MQNQNDLTGGMEHITLDLWLTAEEQRQLAALVQEHNDRMQGVGEPAIQGSEWLRRQIHQWLFFEYTNFYLEERNEKEHGQ